MATISGVVKDANADFAARLVRAYRRSDGAFAGQVVSNATTGAYSITTLDGTPHFAVVHDGAVVVGDPYWNNVVLAMHMNGENNGTTFIDEKGNSITRYGDTKTSTTVSKFNGSSAYFDGAGDYLSCPDRPSWSFGSGDFTIEVFVRMSSVTTAMTPVSQWTSKSWGLYHHSNKFQFFYSTTGSNSLFIEAASGCVANTWHHLAVTRNGGTLRLFVDGTQITSGAISGGLFDSTSALEIGVYSGSVAPFSGYMCDLLITNGVSRYNAGFTPPSSAFLHSTHVGSPAENALILDNITPL